MERNSKFQSPGDEIRALETERVELLREIDHRVKNNFQVILSMLSLQARSAESMDVKDCLNEAQNRINTMAIIHEQMCGSGDLSAIDMTKVLIKMIAQMHQVYSDTGKNISAAVCGSGCVLPISLATPLGLIAHELLSNAFKHAFVDREAGEIVVSLDTSNKGDIHLTVSDNGIGIPKDILHRTSNTMGLHMIEIMEDSMPNAKLAFTHDNGTKCRLEFKVHEETPKNELLEKLAILEHEQWIYWSKAITEEEAISPKTYKRWLGLWCPYEELSENQKDDDRKWARIALDITREFEMPPVSQLVDDIEDTVRAYDAEYSNPAWTSGRIWTAIRQDLEHLLITGI